MGLVEYEEGEICRITLNRPEKLNAINREMLDSLIKAFERAYGSKRTKVIMLSGNGRSFCAGLDIAYLLGLENEAEIGKAFDLFHRLNDGIWSSEKVVVAAIDGYCMGGGNELAAASDFRIATASAIFGQPEVKHGIVPGGGGTYRLAALIGLQKAKRMIMEGNSINVDVAYAIGLVDTLAMGSNLQEFAYDYCKRLAAMPEPALGLSKRAIASQKDYDVSAEKEAFIRSMMSNEAKRRISEFLSRKKNRR